jgi:branched-chain amino acid aminotransferase
MLSIDWNTTTGWQKPQIIPYGKIKLPITATSLHYGISCYEGLNIVQNEKTGKSQSFRAENHLNQFLDSTNHIDMPLFDPNELY